MSAALHVVGLEKRFGGVLAVSGLDLTIRAGEVLALVGPNGAGKSTVINLITGLYRHDRGVVLLSGVDLSDMPAHQRARQGLARTFQTPQVFPELTLAQNVAVGAYRHAATGIVSAIWPTRRTRASRQRILDEAVAMLAQLGIAGDPHRKAGSVSYGDQKRLEVARALLLDPTCCCWTSCSRPRSGRDSRDRGHPTGSERPVDRGAAGRARHEDGARRRSCYRHGPGAAHRHGHTGRGVESSGSGGGVPGLPPAVPNVRRTEPG